MNEPMVRGRVIELQQQWDSLNRVERGDRLQELAAKGCSTRGLAQELGIPDRTIARHMEIAELPEIHRRSIITGQSTKKVLDKNTLRKRQRRAVGRLSYDRDTGILSDQVADIILTFCAGGEKHPQSAVLVVEFEMFLRGLSSYLENLDLWNAPRIRVSKKFGLAALFKRRDRRSETTLFGLSIRPSGWRESYRRSQQNAPFSLQGWRKRRVGQTNSREETRGHWSSVIGPEQCT